MGGTAAWLQVSAGAVLRWDLGWASGRALSGCMGVAGYRLALSPLQLAWVVLACVSCPGLCALVIGPLAPLAWLSFASCFH